METNERLEEELRRGLLLGDILVSLLEPRGFKKVLESLDGDLKPTSGNSKTAEETENGKGL